MIILPAEFFETPSNFYEDVLIKFAQDADNEVRNLALQMVNNLITSDMLAEKESSIYPRDLENFQAFLNYLDTNRKKAADGNLLAVRVQVGNTQPIQDSLKDLYVLDAVNQFYIHKSGCLPYVEQLEAQANDPKTGNKILKVMLQHIHQEAVNRLKLTNISNERGGTEVATKNKMSPHVSFQFDASEGEQAGAGNQGTQLSKGLSSIKSPFQNPSIISPYDMDLFASSVGQLVRNNKQLQVEGTLQPILQSWANMNRLYTDWSNFVAYVGKTYYNASGFKERLSLSGKPQTDLQRYFGSTSNGKSAAMWLLQMIQATEQILNLMENVPTLANFFKADWFNDQKSKAQTFIRQLTPIAMG